jgi:preprotein translocase subunit SecY
LTPFAFELLASEARVLQTLLNIFRIVELRTKLLFTIGLLCAYRIGYYVPLPGVNAAKLTQAAKTAAENNSPLEAVTNYLSLFSGGDLGQSTIFGLGIMPYISASIIIQLMGTVVPALEKLKKEGEPGIRKMNEWTRYLTVAVCFVQSAMWIGYLSSSASGANSLLHLSVRNDPFQLSMFWFLGLMMLTAGSVFLMWLGEQIDHYGIGNGVSLIITAGIVARMPDAVGEIYRNFTLTGEFDGAKFGPVKIVFLMATFVFIVAGSIFLTQAQRRIPIEQAKHVRGRKVYGGQSNYLPLRVNHAGVMPIIFASSLMLFPSMLLRWLATSYPNVVTTYLVSHIEQGKLWFELIYCAMIFFFSYFWNTVQFNPKEMSTQLRDYGTFIKGIRPGPRTAEYLQDVMNRVTFVGAGFLCIIAVVPQVLGTAMDIKHNVTQFLGGTGLLIVISVLLDLVNRIEANLVMRNYGGFMESSRPGRNKYSGKGGAAGVQSAAGKDAAA